MHFRSGVEAAALGSLLTAVPAVVLLASAGRRHTGPARRAHLLVAAGGALAVAAALAGLASALLMAGAGAHDGPHRNALGSAVAIAMAFSIATMITGVLMLPGAADNPATAVRHLLDGLVIATAAWFVGWVLLSEPTRILTHIPYECLPVLLPTATTLIGGGLTAVLAMRAHRPRHVSARVGAGVTFVALSGTALAGGICRGWPPVVVASSPLLCLGLIVVAHAMRGADRPVLVKDETALGGTAYVFLPMLAMAGSAAYHLLAGGTFDAMGIAAGSLQGFLLAGRQYLAVGDVHRYARRLRDREAHFRELAHTDPLTGLANRRGLLRALGEAAAGDRPCALIGLDLDGFKNVNDMRGHDVGDAVLVEVATRLRAALRPEDLAARLGGDEFAVLMAVDAAEAQRTADRLLAAIGRPYELAKGTVFLSVSIGVATRPTGDVPGLMRNADLALRYAKQRGKNRVERYDVHYDERLRRRTTLEHELRHAIDRGELHLVFQPVVALPSVRPVGAEVLLRWTHPRLGAVRPGEFIPLAEDVGLICRLGGWVLNEACGQLSHWLAAGHDVWVSVNVSPRELHAPQYAERVAHVLRKHRVPAQRLVLEVTEHAVATDLEELVRKLCALRRTGVRIALDDFGAGYSSLGQLRNLPVDILKIDHSLVAEPQSPTGPAAPLVDVVVRLGHRLGLEVIAEGMGTPAQRAVVEAAGCRLGQGSLFGWGVPAEHFEALLTASVSGVRPVLPPRPRPPSDVPQLPPRGQIVMLAPGVRQLRALLPTDPAFDSGAPPTPAAHPAAPAAGRPAGVPAPAASAPAVPSPAMPGSHPPHDATGP